MICLFLPRSGLSTATIVFYTCVCLPLLRLARCLSTLFSSCSGTGEGNASLFDPAQPPDLPVVRFCDLQESEAAEVCSICLAELEGEDVVSKLSLCGHLFHADCIETWLLRDNFTCPLCRSLVFADSTSQTTKSSDDDYCVDRRSSSSSLSLFHHLLRAATVVALLSAASYSFFVVPE